jgi:hypothetical protein
MPFSIRPYRRLPLIYFLGLWSIIALLVLSSGPAYAEWVQFDKTKDRMTTYVDPDSIRRKGDLVKMWYLTNYSAIRGRGGNSYLSTKIQAEYDCTEERFRILAGMQFSGNMGSGESVNTESGEGNWEPVPPASMAQRLWKVACGKE